MAGMSADHPGSRYVHAEMFIMRIKQRSTLCIEPFAFLSGIVRGPGERNITDILTSNLWGMTAQSIDNIDILGTDIILGSINI